MQINEILATDFNAVILDDTALTDDDDEKLITIAQNATQLTVKLYRELIAQADAKGYSLEDFRHDLEQAINLLEEITPELTY